MRVEFTQAIQSVLKRDPDSLLMTGDLGFNAFESLAATAGRRFLNAGVAEQNMIGVAAGMALSGVKPWVYSIVPFVTFRCLEQIRNDLCLHNLPVKLVGNGGGYTYGIMGSTHHALEDLGVLKPLPNLHLYFPITNDQVGACVDQMSAHPGPAYLRLGISGYPSAQAPLHENPDTLTSQFYEGDALTVVGIGHATQIALSAFLPKGVSLFGISRYPFDLKSDQALLESLRKTRRLVVLDEHYWSGSLAESLVASLSQEGIGLDSVDCLTAKHRNDQRYGSQKFHLKQSGMTPEDLLALVRRRLAR